MSSHFNIVLTGHARTEIPYMQMCEPIRSSIGGPTSDLLTPHSVISGTVKKPLMQV